MKTFESLSNEDYHSLKDYISSSFVKSVSKHSIAKALQPTEPSAALMFGDAMHTYFEDKELFKQKFVVFDDTKIISEILLRRPDISAPTMTKDYKTFKSKFEEELKEGQTIISVNDYERIEYMQKSVAGNEAVAQIYFSHNLEEIDFWDEYSFLTEEEDEYGLLYRVRPDRLLVRDEYPLAIIDWKSCRDASIKSFRLDFWKYRYDLQAAFYCGVLDVPMDEFYFVAIEKEFPYNSAVYSISEDTQINAIRELEEIKERIGKWKENPSIQNLGLENSNTITYL